ncbi:MULTISPECIES: P-loop NTPase fold protein [unclassified Acinetobacter]|uniref:P-loop NTPase fold protein n=1 Tax=unclassified Acinetobacter TaxID=196816 RepID=UPI0015D1C497|nr:MULTISPECIES: P-loop NTPase fold protein [unclassified Acinetobacter]
MNQSQEQRLEEIFRTNNNNGIAIAITGCWGVGKTFFWNKFRENYKFKNKYIYVSLFGLESLSDLKTHIYSNIENNHSAIEIPRWIRGLPSILKDTKISQFGISASAKVFDSLMFNQVKDAVICFDDFERMSNKLDIKDVMGLANQLKLEKNCQVILILDESKTEEKNKEKYAEYKEKLIDETIKITSVESLIRANTKDIDAPLVELMVKFADELEIHNFRFFQKVIKLYKHFLEQLHEEVATTTKEIILVRILQGYLIDDFPKFEFEWGDSKYISEKSRDDWSEVRKTTYEALKRVSYLFTKSDLWLEKFINEFQQTERFNSNSVRELVSSDLIAENKLIMQNQFMELYQELWNCTADETFIQRFFDSSKQNIGLQGLGNLDFAITILENLGAIDKSKELEILIKEWIAQQLKQDRKAFRGINALGQGEHRFRNYIEDFFEKNPFVGLPSTKDSIFALFVLQQYSEEHESVIKHLNKEDLKQFIEIDYFKDDRFSNIPIMALVEKFHLNLKVLFKEILEDKKGSSVFSDNYLKFLISRVDK